ncbi:hypothetical protein [Myceligenerans crystallogenes]|uniref:CopG family transcriptional regulator n=1 Tax=Myceligenerans crystallogenes TaxID=316335 RepID=A0ABP4ZLN2_9MICO
MTDAVRLSISFPTDLASDVRDAAGERGVTEYVVDAVRHQLAMDKLDALVADFEMRRGPLDEAKVEAAEKILRRVLDEGIDA